jgi:uncharacterized SAM-binding protein YcdF (DUF218 family)
MSVWRSDRQTELPDKRSSKLSGKRMKIAIGVVVVICLLLFLFREQWLMAIGNFLIVQDPLHPTDVIHVIAGEDYRTDYAIQLYKQGYAKTIFFTGGCCNFHNYYHGLHGLEVSLSQGVPLNAIAYDDSKVTSTYMEAERLREWISKSPTSIRSVIVVSDPFHMRRARWAYKKILGNNVEVQMAPVPFAKTPYQQEWWKNGASRKYIWDEYTKYLYYVVRYQFSQGKIKDWLKSLDTE